MAQRVKNNNVQITQDSGIVIYDINANQYFCGLNTWDKQLRKAKIYHKLSYAENALQMEKEKNADRNVLVLLGVEMQIVKR